MMNSHTIQVLRENYTGYDNHEVTFYEWLVYNHENEIGTLAGLFKDWDGSLDSLDEDQKRELSDWFADLEIESDYSKAISNIEGCYIDVFEHMPISDDADLVLFNFGEYGETTAAVIYGDGTIFTPRDWQSGEYPMEPSEVKKYSWMELSSKREAIVFNGLPRLFI